MCKYCDSYIRARDIEYIDRNSINILDDVVQLDIETYISSLKPAISIVTSIWVDNCGPYKETMKRVPITFCPFCGADLEIEREKYEKQESEKFEKSQKEFDEWFSWYPEGKEE